MAKENKFLRLGVRVNRSSTSLFDALTATGPYYAPKMLVRLAEIGLAVEEGRLQSHAPETADRQIVTRKSATPSKQESSKDPAKEPARDPAVKPHYKVAVGSPAAAAMANMFPDD